MTELRARSLARRVIVPVTLSTLAALGATLAAAGLTLSPASAESTPTESQRVAEPKADHAATLQRNAQSTPNTVGEARRLGDTFAQVAERASRAVVSISVETRRNQPQMQMPFGFFFGQPGQGQGDGSGVVRGGGSGVITRADGVIVTNHHVVKDAERIEVLLRDGRKLRARVLGVDEATDLAVLKIDATGLPTLPFANSSQARVGEWVLAIGSPFGLNYTLTAGVLSATGRGGLGANEIEDYLQTDASINPGNSGGPLINLNGEVLGINTMIIGRGTGIGFAIPSNLARNVTEQLAESGAVTRAWIGVAFQELTPELASSLGAAQARGALVSGVTAEGPAKRAGIRVGDIVTSVDDEPVQEGRDLLRAVLSRRVGSNVRLGIVRDGQRSTLTLTTTARPTDASRASNQGQNSRSRRGQHGKGVQPSGALGLTVEPITPDIARQLGYRGDGKVVVTHVVSGSPADRADLRRGDVIVQADRRAVQNTDDVASALSDGQALLQLDRGDASFFAVINRE